MNNNMCLIVYILILISYLPTYIAILTIVLHLQNSKSLKAVRIFLIVHL